ncbi:OLC1v1006095C1 [Oldenlandia corymbosa var. corymbosa]|uniref:OLC1v1006095C1 n=1 Tax=Oldenlandia corymbosa var. corymbosa TaxID=529605 RepID=A0AAV1DIK4_OLDCO|nr:OLC1v1006095C1 [Oldenlandia corymbosa var. corymbosa]
MCVTDEYYITRHHHFQLWAWDPETSTWDCRFETRDFPQVNTNIPPKGAVFHHDWLYPVFLSHKSSPTGQFIVKEYDNRHLLLYSVSSREITHFTTPPDLESSYTLEHVTSEKH